MNIDEVMKVRQSSRRIIQELGFLDNLFSDIGSYSQCHALYELKRSKYLSGVQLAKLLNLEKSSVSRLIKSLQNKKYCVLESDPIDARTKLVKLTKQGEAAAAHIDTKANQQVFDALAQLSTQEKEQVISGLYLYAKALKQSRIQAETVIRKIQKQDVPRIIEITKAVWLEFGFDANHPNAKIIEEQLNDLMRSLMQKQTHYYVILHEGDVVGGGGIRAIGHKANKTCEIQNMYFLPEARGLGLGSNLLKYLIKKAQSQGYEQIYLETMDFMHRANTLYQKHGFKRLKKSKFSTGHNWTNRWYLKRLTA